jgi:hypothetical protein
MILYVVTSSLVAQISRIENRIKDDQEIPRKDLILGVIFLLILGFMIANDIRQQKTHQPSNPSNLSTKSR